MESLLTQTRELQTKIYEDFTITAKAPIVDFSRSKEPTSAFTFKTPWRHYAKQRSAISDLRMKLLHRLTDTLLLVIVTPTAANSRLADYQIIQIIQLVILRVWLQTLPAFTQKHTGHGPRAREKLGATTYSSSLVTPQHHGTLPSILISALYHH